MLMMVIVTFSSVALFYDTARAGLRDVIIGGALGAGVVLAWPTISGAAVALGGGIMAAGAAVTGAVATAGAAVGGAVAGAGVAVGGAVTAGFGAIGGAVAAITASPLFVPALIIAGVAIAGFFIYKHFKNKKASESAQVTPNSPLAKYDPSPTATKSKSTGRISEEAAPTADKNSASPPASKNTAASTEQSVSDKNSAYNDNTINGLQERYTAAYKNYVRLLETDTTNGSSPEVVRAFSELKKAQEEYRAALDKAESK